MKLSIIVATVVGAIVYFVLGFLIFGLALAQYIKDNTIQYAGLMKEPMPDLVPLFLSNVLWSWLLAYIFDQWAGFRSFVSGAIGGAVIMGPAALAIDLQYLAFMNIYKTPLLIIIDVIAVMIMSAIVGGVIGWILGFMSKPSADA